MTRNEYNYMSEAFLYSLAYAKSGDAIFFSHLDTLRIFERAIRRAGLDVCFTRGCNPHIRLSFYRALPLGVAVDGEWFSLKLAKKWDLDRLIELINSQLPEGFAVLQAVQGKPWRTEEDAPELIVEYSGSPEKAEEAISELLSKERIEVRVRGKRGPACRDVKPFFKRYEVDEGFVRFAFQNAGERKPRVSDLAKTLYSISKRGVMEVDLVRIARCASIDKPAVEI